MFCDFTSNLNIREHCKSASFFRFQIIPKQNISGGLQRCTEEYVIWWMTYTARQQCRRHSWNRRKAAFDNRCEKIAGKTVKIKIVWNFWNCLNFFEKRCWQERKTMVWYNTLKAMSRKQSGKIKWQQKNVEKSKKSTWQTEIKVVKYISCQTKKEKCI